MNWERISEDDKAVIERQIQRPPRNLYGIARRCAHRCPQVVVNYPLPQSAQDAHFFPTVFWLTCPEAVRLISRIEQRGYIGEIQRKLDDHRDLRQNMRDAHLEYIYIRRSLIGPEIMREIKESARFLSRDVERTGIGGIADMQGVKCLHTHYAHYLATRNNPVGQLVEKMLEHSHSEWRCQACHSCRSCQGKNASQTPQAAVHSL